MPWKTIYVLCFHCTFYHRVNSSTSGNLKKKTNLWNWVFHIIRGKCDFHQFIYLIMEFAIGKLFPTKSVEFNFRKNYWKQYYSGIWWIHSKTEFDWKDTFQKFYRSLFKMWLPWMHQSNPVFPWNLWKMIFHCNLPVADEFTQKLGKEGFRIKDTEGS